MSDTRSASPVVTDHEQRWARHGGDLRDGPPVGTPDRIGHGRLVDSFVPDDVIGYDALWDSAVKCLRGVRWKGSAASFELNLSEQVARLCNELHDGSYRPLRPTHFKVTSPKERDIVGIRFRDRVYQRSLNDNAVYPMMSPSWIYDNCACQRGKGTDFARARLVAHTERLMRESSGEPLVLMADVRGYYPNMRHDVAERTFRKRLDDWTYDRVVSILRHQYHGDIGYNPGSQVVQIAGISVLSELDHLIKERMGARHYVRYMDDMRIVSDDRAFLMECLAFVAGYLNGIGFCLNDRKTVVAPMSAKVPFCGFDFVVRGGSVLQFLCDDSVRRMRRRVGRLAVLEGSGLRPPGTSAQSYRDWRAHAEKGCSSRLLYNNDKWFSEVERKHLC